tara:strand:- start:3 stop:218 length:216 start_codon:yes stop_codon:yes gene_type:complete
MTYALKDLERYRKEERKRQRILVKAQKDMQDFRDKVYWEDTMEGFCKGAVFTVAFLGLCCTLGYVFAKLTL